MRKDVFIAIVLSIVFHLSIFTPCFFFFATSQNPIMIGGHSKSPSPIAVDVVGLPKYKAQERKPSKVTKSSMKITRKVDNRLENALNKIKQEVEERRGNIKSEGYKGEKGESHWYLDHIHDVIYDHLQLPPYLLHDEKRTTQFIIFIDRNGAIKNLKIKISSGSEEFDMLAEEAIHASNPFEPPPPELRGLFKRGVLIDLVSLEDAP